MSKVSTAAIGESMTWSEVLQFARLCNSINWQAYVLHFLSDGSEEAARSHPKGRIEMRYIMTDKIFIKF
jgi:hypothetical protein